jgi:hypothetical protein
VRITLTLLVFAGLCGGGCAIAARHNAPGPCLHYRHETLSQSDGRTRIPQEVTLSGELIERTYWGPPNWGEHPDTDRLEDAWLLILDRPICVEADSSWVNNASEHNVIVVQLVVLDPGPDNRALKNVARLVTRRVTVSGFLDHADTGHHRTPVLLVVASIAPSNNRSRGP